MLSRLLGMIYILMNKGTVRASELAERFEVSVRTIYRDVEVLSMAGIPVYTKQGKNGGISLTDQFVLDKMMISKEEQVEIIAALASLEQTTAGKEPQTLSKLGDFFQVEARNWVSIDFSDWSNSRQELFEQIKKAILQHCVLEFDYYGQFGEMSHRRVEPVQLLFKEYTWYLSAYCLTRKAMRVFKVLRMKRVEVTQEKFLPNQKTICQDFALKRYRFPKDPDSLKRLWEIEIEIDASEAYRIYDRFDEEEITVRQDGSFLIRFHCILDDWVYGMILSFGPTAKVLQPAMVREEVKRRVEQMVTRYHAE